MDHYGGSCEFLPAGKEWGGEGRATTQAEPRLDSWLIMLLQLVFGDMVIFEHLFCSLTWNPKNQ